MITLSHCTICPRSCGVNRNAGHLGYCGSDAGYNVSSICIHRGEEPPIGGLKGICNVFFTGCNMHCVFCQNYQISRRTERIKDSPTTLMQVTEQIMQCLDQGIEAVGFVTPTHYTPHVKAIIAQLHRNGYAPITVYNSNGFDKTEIIKSFEGLIDVYLPDFKYMHPVLGKRYSDAEDYPDVAKKALQEMFRQKGSTVVLNENGQAVTGLIVRHLVLPSHAKDSIEIMRWIASELSPSVSISLMSQYYPTSCVANHPVLGRKITAEEYQEVLDAMDYLGFHKGWTQECGSSVSYNPDFNNEHPFE